MIGVSAREEEAEHQGGRERDQHQARLCLMCRAANGHDEETEAGSRQRGTGKVESMHGPWRRRQRLQPDRDRNEAEGKIDCERPRP